MPKTSWEDLENRPEPPAIYLPMEDYLWLTDRLAEEPRELPRLRALLKYATVWEEDDQ